MKTEPSLLLVDDEPHMLRLLRFALREIPATIHTAISGEEALRILQTQEIRLVVLDYEMPGFNGAQMLAEMRKIPRLAAIPVMLLTSRDQTLLRTQAATMQCTAFMNKPFSPSELASLVRKLLRSADEK